MSCGIDHRHSGNPTLLWLWCRLADAALNRPLAWELTYAMVVALKRQKKINKMTIMNELNALVEEGNVMLKRWDFSRDMNEMKMLEKNPVT